MKKGEKPTPQPQENELDVFEEVETPKTVVKETSPVAEEVLHMAADVAVHLVAVIGRKTVSVKDVMNYHMGEVIELGRPLGETIDLVANGKLFARGELVDIDGKLGVRIVKLVK